MTNIMKTTAVAALLAFGATGVSAASFGYQTLVDESGSITLKLVRADEAGVVVIYDYTGGEFGEVLGTSELNEGANTDVIVALNNNTAVDMAAVIYSGPMTDPTMAAGWIELDVRMDDNR
ncbi:DUF7282 domain-containing protein [Yoonia sp. MH D7]